MPLLFVALTWDNSCFDRSLIAAQSVIGKVLCVNVPEW